MEGCRQQGPRLKQKYFPNARYDEIEIHATDIFNHKGAFKNMSLEKRLAIFADVMTIVSEIDCSISAILIRKDQIKSKTLEIDIYALELLFERLCYYHNVANGENRMEVRDEQYGILMIDSVNPKYDNKIRVKVRYLFENGTRYQKTSISSRIPSSWIPATDTCRSSSTVSRTASGGTSGKPRPMSGNARRSKPSSR